MNGTTSLRYSVGGSGIGDPAPVATVVVYKDDAGYGMKVSGDNPVYVQSVKEGGAAARAGLNAGDKIIKVNGVNVTQSTHTEVVRLIKSSTQVVLTVQQEKMATGLSSTHHRPTSLSTSSVLVSPTSASSLHRSLTAPASSCTERITGPQPVDHEKRRYMENQRVLTLQLMLEKEQSYVDKLRSELAKATAGAGNANNIASLQSELASAERRLKKLQEPLDQLCSLVTNVSSPTNQHVSPSNSNGGSISDTPPPLPSRKSLSIQSLSPPPLPPRPTPASNSQNILQLDSERHLSSQNACGISYSFIQGGGFGTPSKHQRTKSSPEQLGTAISPAEASRLLIASESMNDLSPSRPGRHSGIDLDDPPHKTPPGTPPPPYPAPILNELSSPTLNERTLDNFISSTPPRLAYSYNVTDGIPPGLPVIQQPIISMEDDDMSDQEVGQLEDHGPFKSLSKLKEHHAHLSVFINYVLCNSDPSSLLFYLITDLYRDGNAKEMKKWAYEIHSSFLVPGAPLRLSNVDENVAREIDNVLLKEPEKEEKLRQIFFKARTRAKEELNEQLADWQQKRIAGLGTLYGPSDVELDESTRDKSAEMKIIEKYLNPKMDTYLKDIEKENVDQKKLVTASSLATVLTKVLQVRSASLDRVPIFVAKDKSHIKAKLSAKARKLTVRGHHFLVHQYFTVTYCNHCQFIIGGVGPQGYECGNCSLNVHHHCVRVVEENCPGPLVKKERGNDRISKFMERIRPEKKPPSQHHNQNFHHVDRIRRTDDDNSNLLDTENGDHRGSSSAGNVRGSSERGRVSGCGSGDHHSDNMNDPSSREDISEMVQQHISSKPKTSNINRSESYKERIHHKRQLREKRKTSDPNLSKSNDCDASGAFPGNSAGSSSNSSLSTRSLDSPSTSLEQVHPGAASAANNNNNNSTSWDSDVDVEPDPPDWTQGVAEEVLAKLTNTEKKRQEVINELFHTERSHVRALKVLSQVFHRPLLESQVLGAEQINLLFSNLDEMVTLHSQFNQAMKRKRKENPCVEEVGELLLDMFDGEAGEVFERAASKYCAKQQIALRSLRDQRRKDPKLNTFLNDVEANPLCRRLQLKDHILTGMLRLTKYPLLFENLSKYTPESDDKEKAAVVRSLERSKEILSRVNQAVREAEDQHRLAEIQRTIDRTAFDKFDHPSVQEFKNLDITKRRLIHEGPLQWRVVKGKPVDLHVVLLDDTVLLLHRMDEDKYVLKFINQTNSSVLSPIVKLSTLLVRHNAVEKDSLYLINTSQNGAQIYDLVASSPAEKKLWYKHISEAADTLHARDREGRRPMPQNSSSNDLMESTEEQLIPESESAADKSADKSQKKKETSENTETVDASPSSPQNPRNDFAPKDNNEEHAPTDTKTETDSEAPEQKKVDSDSPETSTAGTSVSEHLRLVTYKGSIIEPDEVHIEDRTVHLAEPVLTPIESLRRKDEIIKQTLLEKQAIIDDVLNVPKTGAALTASELLDNSVIEKEPVEIIVTAINQANHLIQMINSALTVTESDIVLASQNSTPSTPVGGCDGENCTAARLTTKTLEPSIPVSTLQPVCHSLVSELSQLLKIVSERDEERERLRKELRRSRERLHAIDAEVQRKEFSELPRKDERSQPASIDDTDKGTITESTSHEIFVDAQAEPEPTSTDIEGIKVSSDKEVMGDSVG